MENYVIVKWSPDHKKSTFKSSLYSFTDKVLGAEIFSSKKEADEFISQTVKLANYFSLWMNSIDIFDAFGGMVIESTNDNYVVANTIELMAI